MAQTSKKSKAKLTEIFRKYATPKEIIMMIVGLIAAVGLGASLPLQSIFMGNLIDAFNQFGYVASNPGLFPNDAAYQHVKAQKQSDMKDEVWGVVIGLIIVGSVVFVCAYFQEAFWMYTGESQTRRLRLLYLKSLLSETVTFHDIHKPGELTTHLVSSLSLIQEGMSERYPVPWQSLATFITGFIIGLVKGWKMALVMLSTTPVLALSMGLFGKIMSQAAEKAQKSYADAGGQAQEVLSNIRIVYAYNTQSYFHKKFMVLINQAYRLGFQRSVKSSITIGFLMFTLFATYALGFWFGIQQVIAGAMTGGEVLNVFFAVFIGAMALGQIGPAQSDISTGQGAWEFIRQIVNNIKDPVVGKKIEPQAFKGEIEFKDVKFTYPSRPDIQVLKGFTLKIQPGQKVALVGSSGSGKSTIVQLLLKFYAPESGSITVDGIDLQELDTKWWREQIGLVSQEPVLFDTTIAENIMLGAKTFDFQEKDQLIKDNMPKIVSCCQQSLAHDFITKFPNKFDTYVGERGGQMSGGQRQRIAIARALMKDPGIMLLDEATSALDSTSEKIVQEALDLASKNRTTFIIAHRLSTIKDADVIVVMNKGFISEIGTYGSLVEKQGDFYALVKAQGLRGNKTVTATTNDNEVIDQKKKGDAVVESSYEDVAQRTKPTKVPLTKWPIARLLKMQAEDGWMLFFGILGAAGNGAIFPIYTVILSSILTIFAGSNSDIASKSNFWIYMFLVLAVCAFVVIFIQYMCFSISGERLTARIRSISFKTMLDQEVAFFDDPMHTSGALSSSLAEEADKIKSLTGQLLGVLVQFASTVITGLAIAFYHNAELAALITIAVPLIIFSGYMRRRIIEGMTKKLRDEYVSASTIAADAIQNIRTVLSLNREEAFIDYYEHRTLKPHRKALEATLKGSIYFAISQAAIFFVLAYAFYLAYLYLVNGKIGIDAVFGVIFPALFSMFGVGQALAQLSVVSRAALAAQSFFELVDRHTPINGTNEDGLKPVNVQGLADVKNVEFYYPSRPDTMILKNITQQFEVGKTTALVGQSGILLFI